MASPRRLLAIIAAAAAIAAACGNDAEGAGTPSAGNTTTTGRPAGPTVPPEPRLATLSLDELCSLLDEEGAAAILAEHGGESYDGAGADLERREATATRSPVCRYSWHDDAGEWFFVDIGEPTTDDLVGAEVFELRIESARTVDPELVVALDGLGDEAVLIGPPEGTDPDTGASFPSSAMVLVGDLVLQASGLEGQRDLFEPFLRAAVANLPPDPSS